MMGPDGYFIRIDYKTDFVTGSGMSVGGQLGTVAANVAVVVFLLLGVLAILSKFMEWGESSDMNPTALLGILARAALVGILGGLLITQISAF